LPASSFSKNSENENTNFGRFGRHYCGRDLLGDTVNKWQIICPVVAIAIVAVVFAMLSGRNHHRYFVYAHSRMIGEDLVATTNSPHLVQVDPALQKRLSEFLVSPAGLSDVLIGDEPSPNGDGPHVAE
jgi:hypothetical protein